MLSWLPVTIDAAGTYNGVRVTGYTIYADGQKVKLGGSSYLKPRGSMWVLPEACLPGLAEIYSPWPLGTVW